MHNEPSYEGDAPVFWSDMMARWPSLPPRTRRHAAYRAGRHLHRLWRRKFDIVHMPLELSTFHWSGPIPDWHVPEECLSRKRHTQSHDAVRQTLLHWHANTGHLLSPRETALFLSGFLKREGLDRPVIRQLAHELDQESLERQALYPDREYALALRTETEAGPSPYRGHWAPDPNIAPAIIASEVDRAERACTERPLKQGPRITVFRTTLFGKDTLVKRYDVVTWPERIKNLFRTTRGRRAWAVAETFRTLRVPTPRPYGFLEIRMQRWPLRSYVFTAFANDAITARQWVCRYWRKADAEGKRAFRAALRNALLDLYRAGIYHADTKLANLMVRSAPDGMPTELLWIDLECVRFGVHPTEHRIIRNLVQLNGSARNAWVTESERREFLREMAAYYPFLSNPRVVEKIRRWTLERWHNELRTRCGP